MNTQFITHKKIIFLFSFFFFLFSCGNDDDQPEINYPIELEHVLISNIEYLFSPFEEQILVVENQTEWQEILEIDGFQIPEQNQNIDFENEIIIMFIENEYLVGEYFDEENVVISINEYRDNIEFKYHKALFVPGFSTITKPCLIIKIPNRNKPIEFIEE